MKISTFSIAVVSAVMITISACGGGGGGGSISPTQTNEVATGDTTPTGGGGNPGNGEGNSGQAVVAVISGESENGGLRRIVVENINSIVPVTPVNLGEVVVDGGPTPSGNIGIRVDIGQPAPAGGVVVTVSIALNLNADNFQIVEGRTIVGGRTVADCNGLVCTITIPPGERDIHVVLEPRNGNALADSAVVIPVDETPSEEADRLAREEAEREEAERLAAEEARLAAEEAERIEAERLAAEAEARRLAAAEAARLAAEEAERQATEEAARLAAEEEAERLEAARLVAEEAARLARVEADRLEMERLAAEEAARLARVEADRLEMERLAADEAARLAAEEAARLAAEEEAARQAADEAARLAAEEAARLARVEADRLEMERLAAEEAARLAAEEEAARQAADEAARLAAEEAERLAAADEAARLAAEEAARQAAEEEATRQDADEAARLAAEEAARLARVEAERIEAERQAAEEAERLAREEVERITTEETERLAAEEAAQNANLQYGDRIQLAWEKSFDLLDAALTVGLALERANREGEDADVITSLISQHIMLHAQARAAYVVFKNLEEEARRFFAEPNRIPDAAIPPILKRIRFVDGSFPQTLLPEEVAAARDARFRKGEDGNVYQSGLVRSGEYEGVEYQTYDGAIGISDTADANPPAPLADGESFFREQLEFAALGVWVTGGVADANFRYGSLAENVVIPPPSVDDTSSIPSGDRRRATYYLEGDFAYRGARFYPDGTLVANFDSGTARLKMGADGGDVIDDFGGGLIPDANDADYDGDTTELREVHADKSSFYFPGAPVGDEFFISIRRLQINAEGIVADDNTDFYIVGEGFFSPLNLNSGRDENDNPLRLTGKFHDVPGYNANDDSRLPREVSGDLNFADNDGSELRGGFLGKIGGRSPLDP